MSFYFIGLEKFKPWMNQSSVFSMCASKLPSAGNHTFSLVAPTSSLLQCLIPWFSADDFARFLKENPKPLHGKYFNYFNFSSSSRTLSASEPLPHPLSKAKPPTWVLAPLALLLRKLGLSFSFPLVPSKQH